MRWNVVWWREENSCAMMPLPMSFLDSANPIPPIQPFLHPFLQLLAFSSIPLLPLSNIHYELTRRLFCHLWNAIFLSDTPYTHTCIKKKKASCCVLVPPLQPCLPANAALTSLLPSLSLLSKPILSLLHQLRWAEAHCAKCHLISLSLAAAVIVRTFPLFRRHISLLSLSAARRRDDHHPQHRHPSRRRICRLHSPWHPHLRWWKKKHAMWLRAQCMSVCTNTSVC